MKKVCRLCSVPKELGLFYNRHLDCISCWNAKRRETNKKSVCGHCKIEFRPGIEGRYRFCSEKCRFMKKVEIDLSSGCWIWKAAIQKKKGGYGTFVHIGKRNGLAHRASFRIFNGPLKDDMLVLHSCHNTLCVSPDHLRLGTPKENTLDRIKAGRTTSPKNNTRKEKNGLSS